MEEARSTEYEQQRNARVGANQKRMQELGLLDLSLSLTPASHEGSRARKKPRGPASSHAPAPITAPAPRRRSSRLLGTTLPCYTEVSTVKDCDVATDARQIQSEIYTEEHEKLLGSCSQDWELFKDGYREDGTRIYDSERGKTCHQCRQKTLGLRTWCSQCKSLRGQFCGDCLFMRYGENVIETNQNKDWVCPVCRGICNCSFCRIKKGWAPTGSMYRLVLKLNYKSVAHYLVMTRRGSSEVEFKQEEDKLDSAAKDEEGKDKNVELSAKDEVKDKELQLIAKDEEDENKELQCSAKDEKAKEKKLTPDESTAVRRSLTYDSLEKRNEVIYVDH